MAEFTHSLGLVGDLCDAGAEDQVQNKTISHLVITLADHEIRVRMDADRAAYWAQAIEDAEDRWQQEQDAKASRERAAAHRELSLGQNQLR